MRGGKHNKHIALAVIVSLTGGGLLPVAFSQQINSFSASTVIYVGGSGPGNYSSIQDAVDNASDGDTVFVFNGTYYEGNITISSSIRLVGENKNGVVVKGEGKRFKYWDLFNVSGVIDIISDVYIEGFSFQGYALVPWSSVVISGNILNGSSILVTGGDVCISDNVITQNGEGFGIVIMESGCNVSGNIVSGCKYAIMDCSFYYGMLYSSLPPADVHVYNNIILDNEYGLMSLFSFPDADLIAERNTFKGNEYGVFLIRDLRQYGRFVDNNFIQNTVQATFILFPYPSLIEPIGEKMGGNQLKVSLLRSFAGYRYNTFKGNYWDDWKGIGPKVILGRIGFIFVLPPSEGFSILNYFPPCLPFGGLPFWVFDWSPSKKPV